MGFLTGVSKGLFETVFPFPSSLIKLNEESGLLQSKNINSFLITLLEDISWYHSLQVH